MLGWGDLLGFALQCSGHHAGPYSDPDSAAYLQHQPESFSLPGLRLSWWCSSTLMGFSSTSLVVKMLDWKFRGNEKIFVGGVEFEFYWDVFNWVNNEGGSNGNGHGVFVFQVGDGGVWPEMVGPEKKLMRKSLSMSTASTTVRQLPRCLHHHRARACCNGQRKVVMGGGVHVLYQLGHVASMMLSAHLHKGRK